MAFGVALAVGRVYTARHGPALHHRGASARSGSPDWSAISARRLVRSRRAVVSCRPRPLRRAARYSALSRGLPVAARRARRRRGDVAQGAGQGPQRADAVLQSRPGGAPARPPRRGGPTFPRHDPPDAGPCRSAAGACLHPYRHGPLRRRRARTGRVRRQSRPGHPGTGRRGAEAAPGPGAQHAGLRALSHGAFFPGDRRPRHGDGRCRRRRRPPRPDPGRPRACPGRPRPLRRGHCRSRPRPRVRARERRPSIT